MNDAYWIAWVEIEPATKKACNEWGAYFTTHDEAVSEALRLIKLPYVGKVALSDTLRTIYEWSNIKGNWCWKGRN